MSLAGIRIASCVVKDSTLLTVFIYGNMLASKWVFSIATSLLTTSLRQERKDIKERTRGGLNFQLKNTIVLILLWNMEREAHAFAFPPVIRCGVGACRGSCQLLVEMKWNIVVKKSNHLRCLSVGVIISKLPVAGLSSICIFINK